jgi:type 1 glutamine amidotransferase
MTDRPSSIQLILAALVFLALGLSAIALTAQGTLGGTRVSPDQEDRSGSDPDAPGVTRVLIVTGEDYAGHKWRETTPVLVASIQADPRITTEVLDDLASLKDKDLSSFGAVVLHFKNYDPNVPGRKGFENLDAYARGGGGLVLVHFACGAFEEFSDEYEELVGRVWFGLTPPPGEHQHDPHGTFEVRVTDSDHPIVNGMRSFETTDELYTCLTGDTPIRILADAVSVRNGKAYPIAFVVDRADVRVFHCVLGHDPAALSGAPVAGLFRRAVAWAAGLAPEVPVARPGDTPEAPPPVADRPGGEP